MKTIYDYRVKDINNKIIDLSNLKGKLVLIVNIASQCTFTKQLEDLEYLYKKYDELVVIGFPSNEFEKQDNLNSKEIVDFCHTHYGVTFPIMKKINLNGTNAHELYKFLKDSKFGLLGISNIECNFTKFLVDQKGVVIARFNSLANPLKMENLIKNSLFIT